MPLISNNERQRYNKKAEYFIEEVFSGNYVYLNMIYKNRVIFRKEVSEYKNSDGLIDIPESYLDSIYWDLKSISILSHFFKRNLIESAMSEFATEKNRDNYLYINFYDPENDLGGK